MLGVSNANAIVSQNRGRGQILNSGSPFSITIRRFPRFNRSEADLKKTASLSISTNA
jgi:hypothetical protein